MLLLKKFEFLGAERKGDAPEESISEKFSGENTLSFYKLRLAINYDKVPAQQYATGFIFEVLKQATVSITFAGSLSVY